MAIFLAVWVLAVPALGITGLVLLLKSYRSELPLWRNTLGAFSIISVIADWAWFLFLAYRGQIGGFGTRYLTTRSADLYLPVALAGMVAAFALKSGSRVSNAGPVGARWWREIPLMKWRLRSLINVTSLRIPQPLFLLPRNRNTDARSHRR